MEQGLIHLYCGDGKGKTSAALGLLLRASGAGLRVTLAQFLKGDGSAELQAISHLPGVTLLPGPKDVKFLWHMTAEEKAAYGAQAQALFDRAIRAESDVLILDELCAAADAGLVPRETVTRFLQAKPTGLEVVITGRNPDPEWMALADYISEIRCLRHPYEKGVPARRGIDY